MAPKKKKTKPKSRRSILLRFCAFVFVVYSMGALIQLQVTLSEQKTELERLQQKVAHQSLANKELERQISAGIDDAYIADIARKEFDYVYPNEQVFIYDASGG